MPTIKNNVSYLQFKKYLNCAFFKTFPHEAENGDKTLLCCDLTEKERLSVSSGLPD